MHGSALQQPGHGIQRRSRGSARQLQRRGRLQHSRAVSARQGLQNGHAGLRVAGAEHAGHTLFRQLPAPVRDGLVGQGQGITHRASCGLGQQAQGTRLRRDVFAGKHLRQMFLHHFRRHGPQVELQAAAEHRGQHPFRIRGGQHELQVLGRLFQRFQQGVESVLGELVRLVDHEHLVATQRGLVGSAFDQVAYLIDAAVGGGIQLDVVHIAIGIDIGARCTLAAGARCDIALPVQPRAVEALGQNPRDRGLANAARAGEQVGVMQAPLVQRVRQCTHDVLLARHLREIPRTILPRQDNVTHVWILGGGHRRSLAVVWVRARIIRP